MTEGLSPTLTPRRIGAAFSLLLHGLLFVLLVNQLKIAGRGSPAPQAPKLIQITMAPPSPTVAVSRPKPVPPAPVPPPPPKVIEPPPERAPTPTPIPATPPKPQPSPPKPTPPAAAASATPNPPGATTQAPKPAPPPPEETPQESLIGRIHDNWLEPASAPSQFKCLIRIDYLAGGRIAAVHFVKPCGSYELEESVRRAVWKSQPIPLIEARTAAGTIDIEFTP